MKSPFKILFTCLIIISCNISDQPKPTPEPQYPRYVGFEGTVLDFFTNKNLEGCQAKFWGGRIKDTLIAVTDTNGHFKLIADYLYAEGSFNLKITHSLFGEIVNKSNTLFNGFIDNKLYYAYPPTWVKLHLTTDKNWKDSDYIGYYVGNNKYAYKYGTKINFLDTTFIFQDKFKGMFNVVWQIYNKDSLYENPLYIYNIPWDTTDYTMVY